MTEKIRLDKFLSTMAIASRKEIKEFAKKGLIKVNGQIEKKTDLKVHPLEDTVEFGGEKIKYSPYIYLMLNKPQDYISATEDKIKKTVIDLLDEEDKKFSPHPVGRLDIDTVGLLLLTNDGELTHKLLSPKNKVEKTYYVELDKDLGKEEVKIFEKGIYLKEEDYTTLPAKLQIIEPKKVKVTIYEGKYHQVKRMFEYCGSKVVYLKRLSMKGLELDEKLKEGSYRKLTDQELEELKKF